MHPRLAREARVARRAAKPRRHASMVGVAQRAAGDDQSYRQSGNDITFPSWWCHGSTGIGLVRLRLRELGIGDPVVLAEACAALQSSFATALIQFNEGSASDSGWINSNCWSPPSLGPGTFGWHARVRNTGTGLESSWSDSRHFSIDSQQLTIEDFRFATSPLFDPADVRIYTCVGGFGGIGLGLSLYANTATDGSASGEWIFIYCFFCKRFIIGCWFRQCGFFAKYCYWSISF